MKKYMFLGVLLVSELTSAQSNLENMLMDAFDDAKRFGSAYIGPAAEGAVYSINNGWYNSGEAKGFLKFEISVIGTYSMIDDDKKYFNLNTADYNYMEFTDGSTSKNVATALGENDPDIFMQVEYETSSGTEKFEFELPQGISSTSIDFIPTAFVQGSIGIFKGTEVKARFAPKIKTDNVETQLYGAGVQHEITSWIKGEKLLPIALSGFIGYTNFEGSYIIDDDDSDVKPRVGAEVSTWFFSAIASTKLPVINFYGGVGYITGKADASLNGILKGLDIGAYNVSNSVSGMSATLGTKLSLGFFRINAAYSFQEFDNVSVGLNFGI